MHPSLLLLCPSIFHTRTNCSQYSSLCSVPSHVSCDTRSNLCYLFCTLIQMGRILWALVVLQVLIQSHTILFMNHAIVITIYSLYLILSAYLVASLGRIQNCFLFKNCVQIISIRKYCISSFLRIFVQCNN